MVNLELYRVFYTVAKCGSLTRAADELFISQPAVSQAIKQLESQLGTPLFNRTHRGMELSEQGGKQIFGIVEKALAELDMAENKLKEINSTATGTIRISASDTIFSYVLIDKIAEYHDKYPAVKFDLITGTTLDTIAQLKDNKCDIVFLNLPIDDKDVMLSGSVIAQVFNTLGAIPGNIVIFVIISMAGNALNFALNLLGCYVHDLRLQCLEFFKTFYEDGGKPFHPLAVETKYVDVTEN